MKFFIHNVYIDLHLSIVWMSMLLVKIFVKSKNYSILKSYSLVTLNIIFLCPVVPKGLSLTTSSSHKAVGKYIHAKRRLPFTSISSTSEKLKPLIH